MLSISERLSDAEVERLGGIKKGIDNALCTEGIKKLILTVLNISFSVGSSSVSAAMYSERDTPDRSETTRREWATKSKDGYNTVNPLTTGSPHNNVYELMYMCTKRCNVLHV